MTYEQQLSLSYFWWTWDDPIIRRAMEIAHLDHWIAIVENDFAENRRKNRQPQDWDELQGMHRERQNVKRVASGQSSSTKQFLLGLASVLNRDVQTLFPPTELWIAQTAQSLCCLQRSQIDRDGRRPRRDAANMVLLNASAIALDEALCYARFMLAHPPCAVGEQSVEARLALLPSEERTVIGRVAAEVGRALKLVDPLMPNANGEKTHGQVRNAGLASVRDE